MPELVLMPRMGFSAPVTAWENLRAVRGDCTVLRVVLAVRGEGCQKERGWCKECNLEQNN